MRVALLVVAVGALGAAASSARAQGEFDRQLEPGDQREQLGTAPAGATPRSAVVPDGAAPPGQRDPRFVPEPGVDLGQFPEPGPQAGEAPPGEPGGDVELKLQLYGRVGGGHDTNVFRADRARRTDAFVHALASAELLVTLPAHGTEVFLEVGGETLHYAYRHKANEHYGSAFFELFHPVASWLDAGLQNAFEASRQNLLDDNGDLFPRGRFGSLDEEVRLYAIARPHADLALEVGAGYRIKDYEENRGVDSLDYDELRLDASAAWALARSPRSRLKLKYRYRRRDYREFRARERDGAVVAESPTLDLDRHQLNLTWFQDLAPGGTRLRLVVGAGVTYNRDLHRNDRSYREASASVGVEWWVVAERTRLEVSARAIGRDFLVRGVASQGGRLRHRLIDVTVGGAQRLFDGPLWLFVEAASTRWESGDRFEGYERFTLEAGLEARW